MAGDVKRLLTKYGLPQDADRETIEERRQEQVRTYHPDATPDASPAVRTHLQQHLDEVESDFKVLLDARPGEAASQPVSATAPEATGRSGGFDVKTVRIALASLLGVAILVVLAITVLGGGDESPAIDQKALDAGQPVGLTESQLIDEAPKLEHPAFWVGPRDSTSQYELTSTPDGQIFVRYLPEGTKVGDPSSDFLTVGTYAIPDAAGALGVAAKRNGQQTSKLGGDTVLVGGKAGNAYVVFADQPDLQIEVFSPVPGEADRLVSSGAVVALDSSP